VDKYARERVRQENCRRFLSGFSGCLHVDGYAGYDSLPGMTLVGCWAHARRLLRSKPLLDEFKA